MDALQTLSCRNTHIPLRERVRQALIQNRKAARLANATPAQLHELSRRMGLALHLRGNAARYSDHVESAGLTHSPRHLHSLASITAQAEHAEAHADHDEVLGPVTEPTEEEIETAVRHYLSDQYHPTR